MSEPAMPSDVDIVRAIGNELRRLRMRIGYSRPELVKRLATPTPVNTYACYEQGIRACSIPRLLEICQALDARLLDLLGAALRGLGIAVEETTGEELARLRERLNRAEGALDTIVALSRRDDQIQGATDGHRR